MSLVAVGTVAIDHIETPHRTVAGMLGGSATYITLAARYLTDPVGLVAVVGRDFPAAYKALIKGKGVDVSGLVTDPDGKTFAWGGRYGDDVNERQTLYTDLNVLAGFEPVVPDAFRSGRVLCLGNLDPGIQHAVLDQMERPELVLCDTMNYWIENAGESLARLLRRVDCLMINDSEARQLSGESNLLAAARRIRFMGPQILVVKKGEHGAMLFVDDALLVLPAFPVEAVQDPTGAGDIFMGGFAGSVARENRMDAEALKRAVAYGSVLASFGVERFGPERLLDLTHDAIEDRLRKYRSVVAFPR